MVQENGGKLLERIEARELEDSTDNMHGVKYQPVSFRQTSEVS